MDRALPVIDENTCGFIEPVTSSGKDQPFTTLERLFGWSDVMHEAMTSFQAFGVANSSADSTADRSQDLVQQQDTPCSASPAEPKQQNSHVTSPVLYRGKVYYADQKTLHRLSRVSTDTQSEYSMPPPPPEYNVPPPPPRGAPPPPPRPSDWAQLTYQDAATGQQPQQLWQTNNVPTDLTSTKVPPTPPGTPLAAGIASTAFLQAPQTPPPPSCSNTANMAAALLQAAQVPLPPGAPLLGTAADTVFLQAARMPAPPPMPPPGSSMTGTDMPVASSSIQAARTFPPQGTHLQQSVQQELTSGVGCSSGSMASTTQQHLLNPADQTAQQQEIYHWETLAEREAKLVKDKQEHKAYAAWVVEQKHQQTMEAVRLQQWASELGALEQKLQATTAQQDELCADLAVRLEKFRSNSEALEVQRLKIQQEKEDLEQQVKVLDLAKTMKLLLASPDACAAAAAANKSGCQHCLERLVNPGPEHEQRQAALLAGSQEQQFVSHSHMQAASRKPPSYQPCASLADVLKKRLEHCRIKESQHEEKQQQLEQQEAHNSLSAAAEPESRTNASSTASAAATAGKSSIANPTMSLRLKSKMEAKAKDAAVSHAAVQAVLAKKLKPKSAAGAADSKGAIAWQFRAAQQTLEASAAAAVVPATFAAAVAGKTQATKAARPAGIKVLYHRHSSSK